MNKRFFIYILFMLVVLSAAFGAVSASANITEPALSSVGESYTTGDDALSLSYEENIEDNSELSLSNEVNIDDNDEILGLSIDESFEDYNGTLSLSNIQENDILGYWETVTTKAKGADYVPMSNGFTAFCADRTGTFPKSDTPYYTVHVNTLKHDYRTNERVDNKLRLAVIYYADNPEFQEKVVIPRVGLGSFSYTQHLIWYLSRYDDSPYYMGDLDKYPKLKNAYYDIINRHNNGEWINEEKMTYNDGTYETTYEFLAFNSQSTYQKLFGYKKTVKEIPQIPKVPGMDVTKKSLTPNVKAGEQTKFQITVRNTGEVDLNNVFVKENMPADLEYADYTNKNLWKKSGDFFYYNNVLKVGETASFTIIFNTNKTGSFTNCVVAGSDKTNNKTTENKTNVYKPAMEVTKKSLTPNVLVGEQTLFLITVTNTGDVDLGNVFVEEDMPEGLIYDSFTGNKWSKNGNLFKYNGVLAVGQSASFTIAFNTTVSGKFINCVVAGSNETENKKSNNTTNVNKPGMEVTKKSLTPNVLVGEQTLFLITVTNTGEVALGNVFVEEQIPNGLIYDSFTGNKWSKNGNLFKYNGVLAVGQSASFTIAFNTTVSGKFINCVVAGSNGTENKKSNNTTTVKKPAMDVTKKSLTPNVLVGEQTLFLITVTNTGEVALGNVFVEEDMPEGLIYDSFTGNKWSKNGNLFNYNGVLAVGQSASFTIAFNTSVTGKFINCVVAGSDKTENKTTENTTTVKKPAMDVTKKSLTPNVLVGEQTLFLITVTNTGEVALGNVFVEEDMPEGLIYDSFTGNKWSKNGNLFNYNGVLAVGQSASFTIAFNTSMEGKFINCVVAGSDKTENKTTENTTNVVEPKLDVRKITITPLVLVGDQAEFEIVVTNTGKVALHNVVLEETSYEGLIYDSFTDNGLWTHSVVNGKNVWALNKVLNVNENVNLFVKFNTVTVGNFTNIVTVSSDETKDKTAENTTIVYNNTEPVPEQDSSKNPDINIEKIALHKLLVIGSQAVFEIVVTNTGDAVLGDVCVSEDSFDGLVYDSWYDNTGLWTKNSDLTWKMNSPLYLGEIASFYAVFNTTKTGEFTNIVSVDSNETDKKSANDTVEVIKPDFAVEKIAVNRSLLVGEKAMFEILVQNLGQVDLNNVVVREDSFDGLVYDSFVDHSGLWTKNSDLSWSLNVPLPVGEYAGFFVVFNTTKAGNFVNVVVADSKEIPNKTANDTVEVLNADLEVQKITINKTVYVGEKVMFEIVVHNAGKVILNGVTIHENSFEGLVYDSFVDQYNLWTKNNDLSWTLNTPLYAGEYLSLFVVFNTNKVGTFTNVVSASSDKTQEKTANNVTTVIDKPAPEEPVTPEEPTPVVPEEPVTPEEPTPVEDKPTNVTTEAPVKNNNTAGPETPQKESSDVLPATGNPLVMVLIALLAVGIGVLRRRD